MADDGSWRTPAFRQSVVAKIEEAIRSSGMNTSRNSLEMENHVFQKAKNKEEYLGYVARLILHVREMNPKKAGMGGVPGQNQGGPPGMPDPINALQNLATQGSRNPLMNMGGPPQGGPMGAPPPQPITATNLLQTLHRGPQAMNNMNNMNMNNINNMNNMQPRMNNMPMGPNSGPQMGVVNPMGPQMANQMGNMPNNMNQMGMGGPMPMQQQMGMPPNKGGPMMGVPPGQFVRNPTPNQFLTQSPSPSVQSPAGLGAPTPGGGNQMVSSPALAPSPGVPMMGGPPRSVGGMVPSPGSSLNTPGQPNQSPMGSQLEEQAYREKIRQLSKYIEPLRKMISRMGNDGEPNEKTSKMKKLLEILSNPQSRMPLETLKKCEVVLEKLDFKRSDGSVPPQLHLPIKEYHVFNPLLEAVSNNLQSSVINHTLHRTFGPTLEALFGPEIKLVPPLKRQKIEESASEIPDVLQGEIARLDQRFKVSLDPNQQPGSKSIQLICWLDDKQLPCVPPISLSIPEDYPKSAPTCHMAAHEYNATQFLSAVQTALLARIKKLPKFFSVSQLLDTWEMSVRQASAPRSVPVFPTTLLMGL